MGRGRGPVCCRQRPVSGSGGRAPRAPPRARAGDSRGVPEGDTQALGFACSPPLPKCVGTRPRGASAARESGVRPRHPAPAPQPGGRCRAPVTPAGRTQWGAAPRPGHPGSPGVNPAARRDRQWLNCGLMSGEAAPAGASPPPPPPGQGSPAPRRRRARRGLTPSGQVPAQMFLGCASARGNDRAREASARLGLREKQGKKEKCSVPGRLSSLGAGVSPGAGAVTPVRGAGGQLAGTVG